MDVSTTLERKKTTLNVMEIAKLIPHRYPFLLVDKILDVNPEENYVIGVKNVTFNENFFQGHFPEMPIMPGVLILEALAQTGGVLSYYKGNTGKIPVLLNIKSAKFRLPVKPGDKLILEVRGIHFGSKGGKVKATAKVDEKVVVKEKTNKTLLQRLIK